MQVVTYKIDFVLLTIVLGVLLQLAGAEDWWEPLVEERIRLNVCPERKDDLCGGHVNKGSMCRCDGDCAEYGDCCADIAPDQQAGSSSWRCVFHLGREFYARSKCPEPYVEDDISRSCTGSGLHMRHLQHIPVFSEETRTMYANIFCATCHQDTSSLKPWTVGLHCSRNAGTPEEVAELLKRHKFRYNVGSRSFMHVTEKGQRVFCQLHIEDMEKDTFFSDVYGVRECRFHFGVCVNTSLPDDARKCAMYTAMVYSPRKYANYRNVHCAKCMNVTIEGLECGARKAMSGSDVASVFHLVSSLTTTFRDRERCHSPTNIYDPYLDECFNGDGTTRQEQPSPDSSVTLASSPLLFLLAHAGFFAALRR